MEYHDANLQAAWRRVHGDSPMPEILGSLRGWECFHDSRRVGHCSANVATGEILGLEVDHDYRRRGVGRQLLSLAVDRLRAAGARRIWLATPGDSTQPAYRFYVALGWHCSGERLANGDEILEPPISDGGCRSTASRRTI